MYFRTCIARLVKFAVSGIIISNSFQAAMAQGPCGPQKPVTIACLIVDTIGQAAGISQPPLQAGTGSVNGNAYLVVPLTTSQPIPSPASGFVYTFDPSAGAYVRSSQSFGPILSERADTIGANKLFVGGSFQRFVFDKVDGNDLHSSHLNSLIGTQLSGDLNMDLQLTQFTVSATYGINDRLDVSLAVPFSTVRVGVAANLVSPGPMPTSSSASNSHSASGIGDVDLQLKGTVLRRKNAAVAVGTLFRIPTGDVYEALGTGSLGVKPFVAASLNYKRTAPHVNVGYLLNGKSILAGNVFTGERRQIPNEILYTFGVDAGVTRWLTAVFDVLGTEVIHGDRLVFPIQRQSYNMTNGSVGFKLNPGGTFLVVANVLFRLNSGAGLRTKIAPLVGVSYAF